MTALVPKNHFRPGSVALWGKHANDCWNSFFVGLPIKTDIQHVISTYSSISPHLRRDPPLSLFSSHRLVSRLSLMRSLRTCMPYHAVWNNYSRPLSRSEFRLSTGSITILPTLRCFSSLQRVSIVSRAWYAVRSDWASLDGLRGIYHPQQGICMSFPNHISFVQPSYGRR